eukprot:TRINITY_DN66623_c7_g12_i1.p1 TRINITY_DN66623_c7_g12~~TRINITY_DN66623_c7_g12_i1.p1  ORF type:complete len:1109 (-),score=481.44 TRINITY_DN66623_c7_g12_i1:68-3076(-)
MRVQETQFLAEAHRFTPRSNAQLQSAQANVSVSLPAWATANAAVKDAYLQVVRFDTRLRECRQLPASDAAATAPAPPVLLSDVVSVSARSSRVVLTGQGGMRSTVVDSEISVDLATSSTSSSVTNEDLSNELLWRTSSSTSMLASSSAEAPVLITIPLQATTTAQDLARSGCSQASSATLVASESVEVASSVAASGTVTVRADSLQCQWWDPQSSTWSTSGCTRQAINVDPANGVATSIQCACTHLTEFALLYHARCADTSSMGSTSYLVFSFLYGGVLLMALFQMSRVVRSRAMKRHWLMAVEHTLVVLFAAFRMVNTYTFFASTSAMGLSLKVITILSALPYMVMFWIYTLLVFAWLSIYTSATPKGNRRRHDPFRRFRKWFVATNLVIMLIVLVFFVGMSMSESSDEASQRYAFALGGSILMGVMSIALAVSFISVGTALVRRLTQDFPSKHARKLFRVATVFSVLFVMQGVLWVLSMALEQMYVEHFVVFNSMFYTLDVALLLTVLALFFKSVTEVYHNSQVSQLEMGSTGKGSSSNTQSRFDSPAGAQSRGATRFVQSSHVFASNKKKGRFMGKGARYSVLENAGSSPVGSPDHVSSPGSRDPVFQKHRNRQLIDKLREKPLFQSEVDLSSPTRVNLRSAERHRRHESGQPLVAKKSPRVSPLPLHRLRDKMVSSSSPASSPRSDRSQHSARFAGPGQFAKMSWSPRRADSSGHLLHDDDGRVADEQAVASLHSPSQSPRSMEQRALEESTDAIARAMLSGSPSSSSPVVRKKSSASNTSSASRHVRSRSRFRNSQMSQLSQLSLDGEDIDLLGASAADSSSSAAASPQSSWKAKRQGQSWRSRRRQSDGRKGKVSKSSSRASGMSALAVDTSGTPEHQVNQLILSPPSGFESGSLSASPMNSPLWTDDADDQVFDLNSATTSTKKKSRSSRASRRFSRKIAPASGPASGAAVSSAASAVASNKPTLVKSTKQQQHQQQQQQRKKKRRARRNTQHKF